MESVEAPVAYVTYAKVVKVEEKFAQEYDVGYGATAKFHKVSKGWFVLFTGSWEMIHVGPTKPDLRFGDQIKITIQKVANAKALKAPV